MECYKKTYVAIWIPLLIVLGAYAVSSLAALSEQPEPERYLSNATDHELEMLALMTQCQCIEGNIFCSNTEALTHCKCETQLADAPMMVVCEDDHEDQSDHSDHSDHGGHDDHGHDDHGHDDHHSDSEMSTDGPKPWGKTILVCLIINLTTLVGTFVTGGHWIRNLICPSWNPDPAVGALWANVIIPMFAAGTLLSTTFFLLFPEALVIIKSGLMQRLEADLAAGDHDDHDDHAHRYRLLAGDHGGEPHVEEAQVTWRWGASILGGFLFPVLVHAFFPNPTHTHDHDHTHDEEEAEDAGNVEKSAADVEDSEAAAAADPKKVNGENGTENGSSEVAAAAEDDDEYVTVCGVRLKNLSLFLSYNLGEALHNFTDGIFVGAAYMGCGSTMGNSVAVATIVHEIPNQLAGYLVMINQNGIPPCMALFLNFCFGLIVIVGGLLVLIVEPNDVAIGSIFALGGGIFLHVAISEMLGTAERNIVHKRQWVYVFLAFFVGTIVIGLVLINHTHCGGNHH